MVSVDIDRDIDRSYDISEANITQNNNNWRKKERIYHNLISSKLTKEVVHMTSSMNQGAMKSSTPCMVSKLVTL